MKKGFTIIEIVLYVALLAIVVGAVSALLVFTLRSQAKLQSQRDITFQASRLIDIMTREIVQAESIYSPTSIFNVSPGQLSLETKNQVPQGETSTYVDFYQCGTQVCIKREGQNSQALTSNSVQVTMLEFQVVNPAPAIPSIQINFTLSSHDSSLAITSSASLRQ